jgi:hypothetical protein
LPYAEIGHIVPAPGPDLLAMMLAEGPRLATLEDLSKSVLPPEQHQGTIEALGPLEAVADKPGHFRLRLRLTNRGRSVWSSHDDGPVRLGHEILAADGAVLSVAPALQDLPMPLLPGRTLTYPAVLDLSAAAWLPLASQVRVTLTSADGSWWRVHESWQPCTVPLAAGAGLPSLTTALDEYRDRNTELAGRLRVSAAELEAMRTRYNDLAARWETVADLGATSVKVARRMDRWSRRVPGVAALLKRMMN